MTASSPSRRPYHRITSSTHISLSHYQSPQQPPTLASAVVTSRPSIVASLLRLRSHSSPRRCHLSPLQPSPLASVTVTSRLRDRQFPPPSFVPINDHLNRDRVYLPPTQPQTPHARHAILYRGTQLMSSTRVALRPRLATRKPRWRPASSNSHASPSSSRSCVARAATASRIARSTTGRVALQTLGHRSCRRSGCSCSTEHSHRARDIHS